MPTNPPVVDDPRTVGKVEVMVPVVEEEVKGVL